MIPMRSFAKTFHHIIGVSFIKSEIPDVSNARDSVTLKLKKSSSRGYEKSGHFNDDFQQRLWSLMISCLG